MKSPFELQIDFKNDCNWIYAFFVEFKINRHIWLHIRQGISDKKKPSNLHKNSLFSKRYIISNAIVMENYKWYFKKQFLSLANHNCRLHVWQDKKVLWSKPSGNNGISFVTAENWACGLKPLWLWMFHEMFTCLAFWLGKISYDYCIYQSKFLSQQFWNLIMISHY